MPCILKQKTKNSPGVITFTHNEVLYGQISQSKTVKRKIEEMHQSGEWVFGVHIQGDCSYLRSWPKEDWQDFIMWPDKKAPYLKKIAKNYLIDINCVNFMPEAKMPKSSIKEWDICVISRPSKIKRIEETLLLIKRLMELEPKLKVIFLVPDPRDISKGEETYKLDDIDRSYFDLPLKIFSDIELHNLTFISSSTKSFGTFPISDYLHSLIVQQSRFVMLSSHREGTPRVIGEALINGTPCIVSKNLRCGIWHYLNKKNSLVIDDDTERGARQIKRALEGYKSFKVDVKKNLQIFGQSKNIDKLKEFISKIVMKNGQVVAGRWFLDDLEMRLPGHGKKHNFQFMDDEGQMLGWLDKAEKIDPYNEDEMWVEMKNKAGKIKSRRNIKNYLKGSVRVFRSFSR